MLISKLRSNGIRPTALYCGNVSYNKAYLGDELVFWKTADEHGIDDCMYFKAISDGTEIRYVETSLEAATISNQWYYNLNDTDWVEWNREVQTINEGDCLYVKGSNNVLNSTSVRRFFTTNKEVECHGNIMSLLNWGSLTEMCFYSLFASTSITTAPELPATTLAPYCYYHLFDGCSSLTVAPELPATTLKAFCYSDMFKNCTALTTAPELLATTLVNNCYNSMFYGCSSLNYVKAMFITGNTSNTTGQLFQWLVNVAPTGTFVKNADATWVYPSGVGISSNWNIIEG